MKNLYLFSVLIFFFLVSCNSVPKKETGAYLAGAIVNPTSSYLIISQDSIVKDSAKLNASNSFEIKLDSKDKGLFTLEHGEERQYIYLEPNDSMVMRVNTIEFDESLIFEGHGAKKNNFLINLYLQNEKKTDFLAVNFNHSAKRITAMIDSIEAINTEKLTHLEKEDELTTDFLDFAKKTISYCTYDFKERFSYLNGKYKKVKNDTLPKGFYMFRDRINFNEETLKDYYIYNRFLDNHLNNIAIEDCEINNKTAEIDCYENYNYKVLENKITSIAKATQIEPLKQRYFERYGKQAVILSNDTVVANKTIKLLKEHDYNASGIQELKNLKSIQKLFLPGNSVANVTVYDADLNTHKLGDLINKPTVVHSWSESASKYHLSSHKRIQGLQSQYPDIDFIGVKTDYIKPEPTDKDLASWKKILNDYGYQEDFEYHMITSPVLSSLLKNYMNKVLFVDENGKIVIGATTLDSKEFDDALKQFIEQSKLKKHYVN